MQYKIVSEWKDTGAGTGLHIQAIDVSTSRPIQGVPNLEANYEVAVNFTTSPLGAPTLKGVMRQLEDALAGIVALMRPGAKRIVER